MEKAKLVAYNFSKDGAVYTFEGASHEQVMQALNDKFTAEGYKLESGEPGNGVYGTGSTILRILFGAFVKRYTFGIETIVAEDQRVNMRLTKGMTGISGGVIGYAKMNKEHQRLSEKLKGLAPSTGNEELIYNSFIAK